jgi:predicted nucleic acid-binding Zn ribbon protein
VTAHELPEAKCGVCGTVVAPDARRCPNCGLVRPTARGRNVLARSGFLLLGALLLIVWVVTLAVVAAAR